MPPLNLLTVETATTARALGVLADEWRALEAATPEATGFQSLDWCEAWAAASAEEARADIRIVTLREAGRLVMLWPLQIDRVMGARILRWLGEPMTQYGDALALPGPRRGLWRETVEIELANWRDIDLIALTRSRMDGVLADCGVTGTPSGEKLEAPFVDLAQRVKLPVRNKSARRRGRRLAALGETRVSAVIAPDERLRLTRRALAWKRDWLHQGGHVASALFDRKAERFLEALARGPMLRVHALRVGDEVAAIDLGFEGGGAYRTFLGSFDPRFAAGSPGHALIEGLIEMQARDGLSKFDFLAPADPYKRAFASGSTPLFAHFNARTRTGSLAAFALRTLRPVAKRWMANLVEFKAAS